ncbi:hypothetical protein Taro_040209, partial [Colocasia esculenta]|nr:hypothetical protein [Colocasia esculenta]
LLLLPRCPLRLFLPLLLSIPFPPSPHLPSTRQCIAASSETPPPPQQQQDASSRARGSPLPPCSSTPSDQLRVMIRLRKARREGCPRDEDWEPPPAPPTDLSSARGGEGEATGRTQRSSYRLAGEEEEKTWKRKRRVELWGQNRPKTPLLLSGDLVVVVEPPEGDRSSEARQESCHCVEEMVDQSKPMAPAPMPSMSEPICWVRMELGKMKQTHEMEVRRKKSGGRKKKGKKKAVVMCFSTRIGLPLFRTFILGFDPTRI